MKRLLSNRFVSAVLIGALASLTVWLLWLLAPTLLASWEWSTYDARMRLRGPAPASPAIVIIGRDRESEARFGKGIWDRARFANVIEGLGKAGAAVVAPDFYFADASPPERGGAASDEALVRATATTGFMVYPIPASVVSTDRDGDSPPDQADAAGWLRGAPNFDAATVARLPAAASVGRPLPALLDQARGFGHIAALSDEDGAYRSVPAFINVNGKALPAFGLAGAMALLRVSPDLVTMKPGESLVVRDARMPDGTVRTLSFPADANGRVLVDYAGRWTDGLFPYFSFVDVSDAIAEGRIDELKRQVEGKVVLLLASMEGDTRRTPFETKAPGGFIHANVINTVLTGRSLRVLGSWGPGVITLGMSLLAAVLLVTFAGWAGLGWVGALGLGYAGLAQVVFVRNGLALPVLAPLLAVTVALVAGYLHRYLTEQRGRQWVHHAFSQYLGTTVADRLASDQDALRLGGEEREITIMFADLSGFTKLSTQLAPGELTKMTNRYLGCVVEQVEGTGGYVNQFLGDAVMALWGALSTDPQHAVNGVRAAMAAVIRVDRERREAGARGEIGFSVKIGLNSGPAFVGNIGSETRFNYTAVGETVNIAARIEGVAGLYACQVVVGPLTAKMLGETFLLRELDVVRVKGKDAPIAVSEVLAERAHATEEQVACARLYGEALAHYRARRFTEAAAIWEDLARREHALASAHDAKAQPGASPSAKMAERARGFQANPPAPSWDGVWALPVK